MLKRKIAPFPGARAGTNDYLTSHQTLVYAGFSSDRVRVQIMTSRCLWEMKLRTVTLKLLLNPQQPRNTRKWKKFSLNISICSTKKLCVAAIFINFCMISPQNDTKSNKFRYNSRKLLQFLNPSGRFAFFASRLFQWMISAGVWLVEDRFSHTMVITPGAIGQNWLGKRGRSKTYSRIVWLIQKKKKEKKTDHAQRSAGEPMRFRAGLFMTFSTSFHAGLGNSAWDKLFVPQWVREHAGLEGSPRLIGADGTLRST